MRLAVLALLGCLAFSQVSVAQHVLRAPEPQTGSKVRDAAAIGFVPLDKRFEELTPAQKAQVRAGYENMPEGDEPPFPRDGMRKIVLTMREMADRREARGNLRIYFLIDENGRAIKADIYESPDDPLTNAVARLVLGTPFKPAVCSGKPCIMEFPLVVSFTR